jgi:orotidine-5'-phosphate decarboxylase
MLNIMADSCSTGLTAVDREDDLDALYRFAKLCKEYGTRSCVVSVFTSKTREMVERQYGKSFDAVVNWYAGLVKTCGFTDVVCSPTEASIYARTMGKDVGIITPGVRLPDSDKRDQKRVMTPYEAFQNGATALVIGSDLTNGDDFLGNYVKIIANIEGGEVKDVE